MPDSKTLSIDAALETEAY